MKWREVVAAATRVKRKAHFGSAYLTALDHV
jgi:hypothetical protein